METRPFGKIGEEFPILSFGGQRIVDDHNCTEDEAIEIVNTAIDRGIRYFDTAWMYSQGQAETRLGKVVKHRRSEMWIATKTWDPTKDGARQQLETSLKRLQTDYIDLYQMHEPDPNTPIEETLRALDDIIKEGKVRYIGTSNFKAWQICEALFLSRDCYLHSFITEQPYYNILKREIEGELVPFCRSYHIGIIPWGPLAGGFLTGKYQAGGQPSADWRFPKHNYLYGNMLTESNFSTLVKLIEFAEQRGHTVGELAIAWLLAKSWVSTVIVGVRTVEQLLQNLAGTSWKLSAEDIAELDKISQVNDK